MTRNRRTCLIRYSILGQLGLLSACGAEIRTEPGVTDPIVDPVTVSDSGADATPIDDRQLIDVVLDNGALTGLSRYENETARFRTGEPSCVNSPPVEPMLEGLSIDPLYLDCTTSADCTDLDHGACHADTYFDGSNGGDGSDMTYCSYGCQTDADCGESLACDCGPRGGSCVPAECRSDEDCGGARCVRYTTQGSCYAPVSYRCELPDDLCHSDEDCPDLQFCTPGFDGATMSGLSCGDYGGCLMGRPFLIESEPRRASAIARGDWTTTLGLELGDFGDNLSPAHREQLADGWRQIALMEHASVAAFARFSMQLLALGAPASLVHASSQAMVDETRHAQLAFGIVNILSGSAEGPGPLSMDSAMTDIDLEEIAMLVLLEGCIGETCAALEASWASEQCPGPLGDILDGIASDETRHSELAWQFIQWGIEQKPEIAPRLLERALTESRKVSQPSPNEDWIAGFGLVPGSQRHQLRAMPFEDIVIPCLSALQTQLAA